MATLQPRWIEGKTIKAVYLNPFPTGRGRRRTHEPIIEFTDGSQITFSVDETERLDYGVRIEYWKPKGGAGA